MKRLLTTPLKLFLLYLVATNHTTAQVTITGQLPKDYPYEQLLYTDAGELELPRDYDTLSVEAQSFKLSIPADKVRAVTIGLPQEYTAQTVQYHTFYLQPGDQLQLDFQYTRDSRELVMKAQGPNAAGYEAWAAFNRQYSPPIRYLQPFYDLQPTLPNLPDTIIAKIESILYPYDSLLRTGEIDTAFHAIVSAHFRAHICQSLINRLYHGRWGASDEALTPQQKIKLAEQLNHYGRTAEASPFRDATYAFRRIDWLRYERLRALRAEQYGDLPDTTVEVNGQHFYIPAKYASALLEPNDTLREYLLARYLHFSYSSLIGPEFDRTREPVLAYFKTIYPSSRYLQPLSTARDANPVRYAEIVQESEPQPPTPHDQPWRPVIIDDIGRMNDFTFANQGVDLKLGKYYIDLWATWCQPCLQGFANNKAADSLLNANGYNRLYISIDDPDYHYLRWVETIERYQLNGRHVLAGKVLRKWIAEQFFGGGPVVLPRHLLLIDGQVVEPFAPGPTDLKALEEKLKGG